jgi:hypothetical protein
MDLIIKIGTAIVIFCVILLMIIWLNLKEEVSGFWIASKDFCDESGIDYFCLFLDERGWFSSIYKGYIFAQKNKEMWINQPCNAKVKWSILKISNWHKGDYHFAKKSGTVKLLTSEKDDYLIGGNVPNKLNFTYYPYGELVLYKDDTVYMILYRNAENMALLKEKAQTQAQMPKKTEPLEEK